MGNELNIFLSFSAGIVSFLSPCVLPLIPSYLSYIGGAKVKELAEDSSRRAQAVVRTVAFIVGFSVVFIVLGIVFGGSGLLFSNASTVINIVAGAIVILLGFHLIFDLFKFLNYEAKLHFRNAPAGLLGGFLVGMAFGAGWTPCIGPILAAILGLAVQSGELGRAVVYLSAYSLGLGVPFLLSAIFIDRLDGVLKKIKRHMGTIKIASGIILIVVGLLIALGRLQALNGALVRAGYRLEGWAAAHPSASRAVFAAILGIPVLALLLPPLFRREPRRLLQPVRLGFVVVLVVLAILEVAGVIHLASAIAGWLQFQGI